MIRDSEKLRKFEKSLIEQSPVNVLENFRIANALYEHAKRMGVFPLKDPLDGIEVDISRSRIFNSVRKTS